MLLSKGAIAGIVVAVVIALGVIIWAALTFSKKSSTPSATKKYACKNGVCSESNNGTYAVLTDCQSACTNPANVVTFNCDGSKHCVSVTGTGGAYTSQPLCESKCLQKQCDTSSGTCTAASTSYQDVDLCAASCTQVPPLTYTFQCDVSGCTKIPGTGGKFTDKTSCESKCLQQQCDTSSGTCTAKSTTHQDQDICVSSCSKPPQTFSYNCSAVKGCSQVPGNGGTYVDLPTCQTNCQQLKCNGITGLCTLPASTYTDIPTCKDNCSIVPPQTCSFNCDSVKGCSQVTGTGGTYATKALCLQSCFNKQCNSANGQCDASSTVYQDVNTCLSNCKIPLGCSAYRVTNTPLNKGFDWKLGTFTDAMSQTFSYPLTSVRVTYNDPKNTDTVVTGQRMMAYVGDWIDSGATVFAQWAATYGISPTYSITGSADVPFLYVPQLGTINNINKVGNSVYDPTKTYAQDARTLNGIPGVLIENLVSGRSYRVYMGQPPSMQASERFADNHFGYHNPAAGNNLRNTWYWDFRARADPLVMDKTYLSASTDLYSSYQDLSTKSCIYYQANVVSTNAMSAKLWPNGPASPTDSVYIDFTDTAPLNGQFGVVSGGGFLAKGIDLPNKLGPQLATVLIKPNADVGNGLKKNVLELRTYIDWDGSSAFKMVTSGGLISSKKWASGRYEIRAKIGNRPGMVWAIWNFTAVYKLPSPMSNCGTATCAACINCTDYSTCCSQCSAVVGTKCGTCGPGGAACKLDTDCTGGLRCIIAANSSQCNCQQCESNPLPLPSDALCSGYDCANAVACGWDASKGQCTGSAACSSYTTQDTCNNSGPCQGTLTWKSAAPPIGIKTPWNSTPEMPQNIFYVGAADINDPSSAGPNYKTAVAKSVDAGALLGGLPCSSYYNMEADFCEIPSNAPFFSNAPLPPADTVRPTSHTANFNTYRFTNSAGTGTYTNYYVEAQSDAAGKKQAFIGDGCYHTYAYELHTGDSDKGIRPKMDAFFDGDYIGTSDSFVPDVFSRLWMCSWNSSNPHWNGYLGDKALVWSDVSESVSATVAPQSGYSLYNVNYIDYIRITPFNEANDKFMPDPLDQPNMNQVLDPTQVGVDSSTGKNLPGGSGYKQASCCALVSQPSPYDGATDVQMCTEYAYNSLTDVGIDWLNPTLKCAVPLNGDKVAPTIQSQTMVPFFQTKTAITTQDGISGFGVIYSASTDELNPGGGGSTCSGATVACTQNSDCATYLTSNSCPTSCTYYCRQDNHFCHISC